MKHWLIEFINYGTKEKQYRKYPIACQWETIEKVYLFLKERTFLEDFACTQIIKTDKTGWEGFVRLIGELIYKKPN